jgi:predicted dehydrogenase
VKKKKKKIPQLKKKYPNKKIITDASSIFLDKSINLVSIASYDDTHYEYVLKSIKTNKNIIVEKPLCLTLDQLKNIYKNLKRNPKVKITSNLVLRVNDLFLKIKNSINKKKIFYVEADYLWGRKYKLFEWRSKLKNYSITLGAGIHMIDLVMWLLNEKPVSVMTYGTDKGTLNTKFKKHSLMFYIFKFPNNILVKISANAAGSFEHSHELKIFEKDKTFFNSLNKSYILKTKNNKTSKKKIISKYPDKKNRKLLIRNFIDHLLFPRKKCLIGLKEQINLMAVCFFADKSLKLNKELKIKYLK